MTEPQKFFQVDDARIHRDGFSYSFNRELDPPASRGDLQLRQSFHCSVSREQKCRSRIQVTGNWDMDRKGGKFMLGIVKRSDHTHDPEYKENQDENRVAKAASSSTRTKHLDKKDQIRFYKYKETSLQHDGFVYSSVGEVKVHRKWKRRWHCRRKINWKQTCTGHIWTTGKWEWDAHGRMYQVGIVVKGHTHEPQQMAMQGKKNDDEAEESGSKFYQYKVTCVHRDGFAYRFSKELKSAPEPWKCRMLCTRNTALSCIAALWTTGEWETDSLGRNYQRGILKGRHCHKAYEQFLNEDDTPYVGDGTLDSDQQFLDEDDTAYVGDGALDSDQEFVDEQDIYAIVGDAAMHALDQQFLDEDDWAYDGDGALEMDQEFLDEDDTAYDGDNAMDLDQ